MSLSRHGYTALPQDEHAESVDPEVSDVSIAPSPELPENDGPPERSHSDSRWDGFLDYVRTIFKNNTGFLLVVAAQVFFSTMNVAVKKLNSLRQPVSTFELILVRMGITYVCSVVYMLVTGVPNPWLGPKGVRMLLIVRGTFGFIGLFGVYYSLQFLSLSDSTVITFLVPICTAIAGSVVLKEKFTVKEGLAGCLSLLGVILIARPEFIFSRITLSLAEPGGGATNTQRLIAVGACLVNVLGATGAYTTVRAIGKRAHALHNMVYFSMMCIVGAGVGMIVTKDAFIIPTRALWLVLLLQIGVFGFVAQILLTMGLQREKAGRATMAIYFQIILATILDRVFFHITPPLLSVIGSLIILLSAGYVAVTKETAKKDAKVVLKNTDEETLEEGLLDPRSMTPEPTDEEDRQ